MQTILIFFYKYKHIKQSDIQEYLKKYKLQQISEKMKEELNKEISGDEIVKVIGDMKPNKSPGPDGFMAFFL